MNNIDLTRNIKPLELYLPFFILQQFYGIFAGMKCLFKFSYLYSLLSLISLACCTRPVDTKKVQQAYSLLNSDPDSSLVLLSQCERNTFSSSDRAYYNLVYYMAQDKSGLDVASDSLLRYSYDYYSLHTDDTLYAKCSYYMGKYYSLVDSAKKSRDCYMSAIGASERVGDFYTQYLSTEKLSRLLSISNPDEALVLAHKAYRLLCQYDSTRIYNKVYLLINIGNCYDNLQMGDSSVYFMKKALNIALASKDDELIGDTYHSISSSLLGTHQVDSALFYAQKAWKTVRKKEFSLYSLLASCYLAVDSITKAKEVLTKATLTNANNKNKYSTYKKLARIGFLQNGDTETQSYVDSSLVYLLKLYLSSEQENTEYMMDNFILNEREELQKDRQRYYYLAILSLIIILILLVLLSYYYIGSSRKRISYEREKSALEHLLHESENEKAKLIIESRERQIRYYKGYIMSKIDFSKELDDLKNQKTARCLTASDWLDIEAVLNEIVPGFMESLKEKHPDLKEKDIQFCMLLKLGFNNNDLLRFYERGLQAIKQRLLNLKPVLGIEGKDFSTRDYICNYI